MIYNRTEAAKALLCEVDAWCARTATPPTSVGHVLFLHPGFVGLLRKRLTLSEGKERDARQFLADHPNGWRGDLPETHSNGVHKRARSSKIRLERGPIQRVTPSEDQLNERRIDRDPCPRCGVRADFGCAHSRAPVGMMFGMGR